MKEQSWEEKLAALLVEANYSADLESALEYTKAECWQEYKNSGHTPAEAVEADLSYA